MRAVTQTHIFCVCIWQIPAHVCLLSRAVYTNLISLDPSSPTHSKNVVPVDIARRTHAWTHPQQYLLPSPLQAWPSWWLCMCVCVCVFGLCPGLKHSSVSPLTEHCWRRMSAYLLLWEKLLMEWSRLLWGYQHLVIFFVSACVCVRVYDKVWNRKRRRHVQWCRVFGLYGRNLCVSSCGVYVGVGVWVFAQVTGGAETAENALRTLTDNQLLSQ